MKLVYGIGILFLIFFLYISRESFQPVVPSDQEELVRQLIETETNLPSDVARLIRSYAFDEQVMAYLDSFRGQTYQNRDAIATYLTPLFKKYAKYVLRNNFDYVNYIPFEERLLPDTNEYNIALNQETLIRDIRNTLRDYLDGSLSSGNIQNTIRQMAALYPVGTNYTERILEVELKNEIMSTPSLLRSKILFLIQALSDDYSRFQRDHQPTMKLVMELLNDMIQAIRSNQSYKTIYDNILEKAYEDISDKRRALERELEDEMELDEDFELDEDWEDW